jgi:hypothetical protein
MKEYIDVNRYVFVGTVQELRDMIKNRVNEVKI